LGGVEGVEGESVVPLEWSEGQKAESSTRNARSTLTFRFALSRADATNLLQQLQLY